MINITEKEFFKYLEKYADNQISMKQLIEKLESDYRTVNNKIMEMSIINPSLYYKIVTSHPYKQKSRTDIDFEALMIYIIKTKITIEEAVETFNISRRTIQRRVNEIKDTNPDLYKLFKISVGKDKKALNNQYINDKIEQLKYKQVVIGDVNDEREKFLLDIEKEFNKLIATGMSEEQAAKEMGYTKRYIHRALNELYRLEIEKNIIKDNNKSKEFRKNLSDMTQYTDEETKVEKQIALHNQNKKEKNSER